MRYFPIVCTILAVAPMLSAQGAEAQSDRSDCRVVANRLNANPHSEAFRWALTYGRAGQCGASASLQLVQVLTERGVELASAGLLDAAVLQASANRHPRVFEAALSLAADPSRSVPVRIAATQLALSQYDIGYRLPREWGASVTPGSQTTCPFVIAIEYDYASEMALPVDARARLLSASRMMQAAVGTPDSVRRAARCVEYILDEVEAEDEPSAPPAVP